MRRATLGLAVFALLGLASRRAEATNCEPDACLKTAAVLGLGMWGAANLILTGSDIVKAVRGERQSTGGAVIEILMAPVGIVGLAAISDTPDLGAWKWPVIGLSVWSIALGSTAS